ncbi:MAG: DUF4920 domain-containing protein [Pseudomonadota bacterium]|nr:DUF4920 domain-containing protein [Pseudomonadota bacterium]
MLLTLLFACSPAAPLAPAPAPPVAAAPAPAAAPSAPAEWHVALGEAFTVTDIVPIDQLVANPTAWDGKDVVAEGVVKEVCQKKGCWHTIATADPAVNVMVKDKDYKIFLPKDAGGKKVHIKGTFGVVELPEEEARHYAEDAGRDPSAIVGPQKTFAIDVAGVKFVEG